MRRLHIISALFIFFCIIASAAAQQQQDVPDSAELRAFQLNDAMLHKFESATTAMQAYEKAHPDNGIGNSDANNLDEMAAKLSQNEHARAILSEKGISARDYSKTFMIILGGGIYVGMEKSGMKATSIPSFLSPANMDFIRAHYAELQKIQIGGDSSN